MTATSPVPTSVRGFAGKFRALCTRCRDRWRTRLPSPKGQPDAVQRQFLPAALEIQEAPPSPAGRSLMATLLVLFVVAVLWACFGYVDIVVTAPGRIVPSGYVKTIQAIETGAVSAIHVQEGDRVRAGQPLISLDPTYADADQLRIDQQIAELTLEMHWRRALADWLANDSSQAPAAAKFDRDGDRERATALFEQHRQEITTRLAHVAHEQDATRAGLAMARAESAKARATLPILADRVAAYKSLYDAQFGAKVTYLEMLQQRTELEQSLPVLQAREKQLEEQLTVLEAQFKLTREEQQTQNLLQLARVEAERDALVQEGRKASQRQQRQVLSAPVDGTVQQLAVHTVGGVVTPAQELLKIVPEDASIEVEALLQNRDIGFVREGQSAEVKIDTFNFTKYGLIDAQLLTISDDAVEDKEHGWVFKLRLQPAQDDIEVDDKRVKLSPGMAVTAEIKTGKRRLIEFFLSPLLRYRQESVRER